MFLHDYLEKRDRRRTRNVDAGAIKPLSIRNSMSDIQFDESLESWWKNDLYILMICVWIILSSVLLTNGQVPASNNTLGKRYSFVNMTLRCKGRSYLNIAVFTAVRTGLVEAFRILIRGAMEETEDWWVPRWRYRSVHRTITGLPCRLRGIVTYIW